MGAAGNVVAQHSANDAHLPQHLVEQSKAAANASKSTNRKFKPRRLFGGRYCDGRGQLTRPLFGLDMIFCLVC